jgi:hypothetical protein
VDAEKSEHVNENGGGLAAYRFHTGLARERRPSATEAFRRAHGRQNQSLLWEIASWGNRHVG